MLDADGIVTYGPFSAAVFFECVVEERKQCQIDITSSSSSPHG